MNENASPFTRREFLGVTGAVAGGVALEACAPPAARIPAASRDPLAPFGVTEAQVRQVMARALASGGDLCDLHFQRTRTNHLSLEDNVVSRAASELDLGVGVRVVKGTETGYAFTESLDLPSMLQAAEVAAAVARGPARLAPTAFKVGRPASYYPLKAPMPRVPIAERVALLGRLNGLVAAQDRRISKISVYYRDEDTTVAIADSRGRLVGDSQPMVVAYVSAVAEDKGRRESNAYNLAGRAGQEFLGPAHLERVAREVVKRTVALLEARPGPVGELPVVLCPGGAGILLHEAIGHGMEADFALRKLTIYTDQVNQRIASEHVTIVDDGTNPHLRGSVNVDDEGNPGQRTVLVEKGVLRTFMHDEITAKHFGLPPTGNGRRQSFRHLPIPRMRNTYMLAGPHAPEEILRSVKRGIYAENFTNGEVNIGAGDYTFYVKNGWLIEDGKLSYPIKDVNIIGNGPESLRRVTMVGNDPRLDEGGWTCGKRGQGVPVGLGLPTVLVSAITVGGTAGKGAA
jgi:TldD protein